MAPLPPSISQYLPPLDPDQPPHILVGDDADLAELRRNLGGECLTDLAATFSPAGSGPAAPGASAGAAGDSSDAGEDDDGPDESYAGPPPVGGGFDGTSAGLGDVGAGIGSGGGGGSKRPRDEATTGSSGSADEVGEEEGEGEGMLFYLPDACASLRGQDDGGDDSNNGGVEAGVASAPSSQMASGSLLVTTRRVIFVATNKSDGDKADVHDGNGNANNGSSPHDLIIDAGCIVLHAMSSGDDDEDDEGGGDMGWHVYCQLESEGDGGGPDEVLFHPSSRPLQRSGSNDNSGKEEEGEEEEDVDIKGRCQALFDAFSRLASLNPMYNDDDEDGGGGCRYGGYGGFPSYGGFGFAPEGECGEIDDDDDDGMICRLGDGIATDLLLGGGGPQTVDDGEEATDALRAEMLQRLDDMLVVPAEYEIGSDEEQEDSGGAGAGDGQFDDAASHDDSVDDDELL